MIMFWTGLILFLGGAFVAASLLGFIPNVLPISGLAERNGFLLAWIIVTVAVIGIGLMVASAFT